MLALFVSVADTRESSNSRRYTVGLLKTCPTVNSPLSGISAIRIASRCDSTSMSAGSFARRSAFHHRMIPCQQRKRIRQGRQRLSCQSGQADYSAKISSCAEVPAKKLAQRKGRK